MNIITASHLRRLPQKERAYMNRSWRNHDAHHGARGVTMTFLYNGVTTDCTAGGAFTMNPQVKVDILQPGLPTFFSRIWSRSPSQVSATATAEAFNPSNSLNVSPNGLLTVTPRCVKPWL